MRRPVASSGGPVSGTPRRARRSGRLLSSGAGASTWASMGSSTNRRSGAGWSPSTRPPGRSCGPTWSPSTREEGAPACSGVRPWTATLFVATGNPSPRENPPPGPDVGSDSIVALDAATGRLRWAFGPTHPHDNQDLDFLSTPNVFPLPGGLAVGAGEKDGTYYVVDARTGRLRWQTNLTLAQERGAVITGSAAVAYGRIFVGTQDYPPAAKGFSVDLPGRLVALDAATGRVLWTLAGPRQILGPPAVSEGVVFAADYDGTVWAVDARNGKALWRGAVGGFAWKGGVTLAPGMVLVGAATPANALVAFGVRRR